MVLRRATYDREAKALYVYLEDPSKKRHLAIHTTLDFDELEGVNLDYQIKDPDFDDTIDVGIEILNVELEDITREGADLPEITRLYSK